MTKNKKIKKSIRYAIDTIQFIIFAYIVMGTLFFPIFGWKAGSILIFASIILLLFVAFIVYVICKVLSWFEIRKGIEFIFRSPVIIREVKHNVPCK